jgi:peptidoglycan/xylan/chitin deacetylase (PgdA/CDA1 family)
MKPLNPVARRLAGAAHSMLAPAGRSGTLLVLIYHRVVPEPDPMLAEEPTAEIFASQMDLVRDLCCVLPLSEALERLFAGSLPARAAAITFDDGYANNLRVAAPILRERGLPATIFVSTGFVQRGRMWNDTVIEAVRRAGDQLDLTAIGLGRYVLDGVPARRDAIAKLLGALKHLEPEMRLAKVSAIAERVGHALPEDLMLNETEIRALHELGFEIGAHTVTHPILTRIEADAARREIAESKATLEAITGAPVRTFAYPNGRPHEDYDHSHVRMVRESGFTGAVSTAWGAAAVHSDRFQIPRMLPWDKTAPRFAARLLVARRELHARAVAAL